MKTTRRASAFSLIEISIVILIIGILVAGVTQSSRLLSAAKLSSARSMTQSAPVASIKNLALWIETTSESSFQTAELDDGATITTWKDINPQTVLKVDFAAVGTPIYKTNSINGLPAVCMNDTTNCGASTGTTNYLTSANFSNLTAGSTVFIALKLPNTLAAEPILSKRLITGFYDDPNTSNIQVSTSVSGRWHYCDGSTQGTSPVTCNFTSGVPAPAIAVKKDYIVSIVYNPSSTAISTSTASGITFFHNGSTSLTAVGTSTPAAVSSPLLIGRTSTVEAATYFKGYIGEIIIFDRALKKEERQSIEDYLGKKWGVKMTKAAI